jgi:hypothetical protein
MTAPTQPNAARSEYFQGKGAGFSINIKGKSMQYSLSLECLKPLPGGSVMVFTFENPTGGDPIVSQVAATQGQRFVLQKSPPVLGVKKGPIYTITVQLYNDKSKSKLLCTHVERLKSAIDPTVLWQ